MSETKETKRSKSKAKEPKRGRPAAARRKPSAKVTKDSDQDRARRVAREKAVEESRELALWIAGAALDKKAAAVEILDVQGKVDYADYLVLMTGRSNRQVDGLAREIEQVCEKKKRRVRSVEGLPAAVWVLLDYGDVVVHVFQEHARGLYDIDGLWLDAARLPVPGSSL